MECKPARFVNEGFEWASEEEIPAHEEAQVNLGDVQLALDRGDGTYQLVGETADGERYGLATGLTMEAACALLRARKSYLCRYHPAADERHQATIYPRTSKYDSFLCAPVSGRHENELAAS